jgi:hypothetical protein
MLDPYPYPYPDSTNPGPQVRVAYLLGLLGVESSMGPLRECRRRRPRSSSPVLLHIDSHLGGYGLGTPLVVCNPAILNNMSSGRRIFRCYSFLLTLYKSL